MATLDLVKAARDQLAQLGAGAQAFVTMHTAAVKAVDDAVAAMTTDAAHVPTIDDVKNLIDQVVAAQAPKAPKA